MRNETVAEQAALFGTLVDFDLVNMDAVGGTSGIYMVCADEAITFCQHHDEDTIEDYWDGKDWYIESDNWFHSQVAPRLYIEG